MTHCEKCISYDICEIHQDKMADEFITFFPNNEDCPHFKNKADFVEVVRCNDCKHWDNGDCYRLELSLPTDFCSYGEGKDT
jgi:hypothetical protein